jgi:hypothetical protein
LAKEIVLVQMKFLGDYRHQKSSGVDLADGGNRIKNGPCNIIAVV